jgi:small subunit ribosomal protein SAe
MSHKGDKTDAWQVPECMRLHEDDVHKMLAAEVHLGTKNLDPHMAKYVWTRRSDGVHILDLGKTWEKLVLAARVIVAIENPQDICVLSTRVYGQRAVLKFAKFIGAQAISGRFTPGTFTNQQQQRDFKEPRLLIVTDPFMDAQPITEASYTNIPTIAFCNSDSPTKYVDIVVPSNNAGKHSCGLLWWFLAREVLYLRGTLSRDTPWDVKPDLFFWRDPDDLDKEDTTAAEQTGEFEEGERPSEGQAGDWPAGGEEGEGANYQPSSEDWAQDEADVASGSWSEQP